MGFKGGWRNDKTQQGNTGARCIFGGNGGRGVGGYDMGVGGPGGPPCRSS